jgi:hypothetical protein
MAPSSYKEVCQAFEHGKMSFEAFLEQLRLLPPPERSSLGPKSVADVYSRAEADPPDNSGDWLAGLEFILDLPDGSYEQMVHAAVDGKQ